MQSDGTTSSMEKFPKACKIIKKICIEQKMLTNNESTAKKMGNSSHHQKNELVHGRDKVTHYKSHSMQQTSKCQTCVLHHRIRKTPEKSTTYRNMALIGRYSTNTIK